MMVVFLVLSLSGRRGDRAISHRVSGVYFLQSRGGGGSAQSLHKQVEFVVFQPFWLEMTLRVDLC